MMAAVLGVSGGGSDTSGSCIPLFELIDATSIKSKACSIIRLPNVGMITTNPQFVVYTHLHL
jgi:hypothetical protein